MRVIIKKPDGRRATERTMEEDAKAVEEAMSLLAPEARNLFQSLLVEHNPEHANQLTKELEEGLYHKPPVPMQQFLEDPYYLGESMTTLRPGVRDALIGMFQAPYREVVLAGSIGLDALVQEADGGLPTLGERLGRSGDVVVLLDNGQSTSTTEPAHHSGIKEVVRLMLTNGMWLDLTPDHEVRVWRDGYKWVPAGQLTKGDMVVIPRRLRTDPSSDLEEDEARLLAYWVADGSSSETRARFSDGNPRTSEEVMSLLSKLGFHGRHYSISDRCWEVSVSKVKRSGFLNWLRKYGADKKTADVVVPDAVCRASDAVVSAFLNRLWACEGCVYASPTECSPPRFTLGMTSERFIRQVQLLLLRFGVRARVYYIPYVDQRSGAKHQIWHLAVSGVEQLKQFISQIGIILGKEDACARLMAYCESHEGNTNVDVIPVRGRDLSVGMTRHGIVRSRGAKWWKLASMVRGYISRQLFESWLAEFGDTDLGREMSAMFPSDIAFESVVSVEPLATMIPVGDVGAHNGNRFVANGISVHNSIGYGKTFLATTAMCRIIYELSCMRDPQRTLGLGPGTEMVLMLISRSLILCQQVLKTAVDDKIKLSPYFMSNFPPKFAIDYTLFPNNIRLTVSSYGAERALGTAIFAAVCDECFGKESLLSVRSDDSFVKYTVGDLWAMPEAVRDVLRVEALDHATGQQAWVPFRMRESTVQPLVRIETANTCSLSVVEPSLDHPVLVRRGDWLIYIPASHVCVGDEIVRRVSDEGIHGGDSEQACTLPHHEGRALGGCRAECLPVADLSPAFTLCRVVSTALLPPEQTYSIETACKTFVADGCVVHNTNFPPKRNAQQIQQTFGKQMTAAHFDIVEKVYRALVRRIKSRFLGVGGDFPGMVILSSSAATLDSFTERKIKEAEYDSSVYVVEHTQWSAMPEGSFCGQVFYVICSKSSLRSRILNDGEIDDITNEYLEEHEAWLVEVPVEYRDDFEANLEDSLRDIAGVSTQAISAFFQRVDAIDACVTNRPHPFSEEVWTAGSPGMWKWDTLCRKVERRLPGGFTEDAWMPREAPRVPRWIHIDTSTSGDSTGFCMSRIDRWVEVVRRDGDGKRYTDMAPYYIVEAMLCIRPPAGEQIYMPDVRRLVYELQAHGYPIAGFSTDSYQCLAAGTRVETARGCLPIEEVQQGDVVLSRSGDRGVKNVWSFGERSVWKLTTGDGDELVGTDRHQIEVQVGWCGRRASAPVIAMGSSRISRAKPYYEWRQLDEIKPGDVVRMRTDTLGELSCVDAQLPSVDLLTLDHRCHDKDQLLAQWNPPTVMTPELSEFLGMVWGNGSVLTDGIKVACHTDDAVDVEACFLRLFGQRPVRTDGLGSGGNASCLALYSRWIVRWLISVGLDKREGRDSIPEPVWRSSLAVRAAFLRGLFGADGNVTRAGGGVSLSTKHKRLAQDVRVMLRSSWGIPSKMVVIQRKTGQAFKDGEQFVVCVRGGRRVFFERIGFGSKRKMNILQEHLVRPGRDLLVRVDKIEQFGTAPVYDLEVQDDPSYVANGFVVHNSVEMHQQIRRRGIHSELISVDTSTQPYEELKSAIYEHRIEYYKYEILLGELRALEYDRLKGKIDHPKHKTKDVADSLAGATWGLRQRAARLPWAADADTPREKIGHEHQWVSPLIPAEDVDVDEVRTAQRNRDNDDMLPPLMFGSDE